MAVQVTSIEYIKYSRMKTINENYEKDILTIYDGNSSCNYILAQAFRINNYKGRHFWLISGETKMMSELFGQNNIMVMTKEKAKCMLKKCLKWNEFKRIN